MSTVIILVRQLTEICLVNPLLPHAEFLAPEVDLVLEEANLDGSRL